MNLANTPTHPSRAAVDTPAVLTECHKRLHQFGVPNGYWRVLRTGNTDWITRDTRWPKLFRDKRPACGRLRSSRKEVQIKAVLLCNRYLKIPVRNTPHLGVDMVGNLHKLSCHVFRDVP